MIGWLVDWLRMADRLVGIVGSSRIKRLRLALRFRCAVCILQITFAFALAVVGQ